MIRSMTGFGEAERAVEAGRLRVEIRTVNHRFLNTHVRMPPALDRFETELVGWLRSHLVRGHARVNVTLERPDGASPALEVDLPRARRYREALERLRDDLGIPGEVDLSMMVRFSELFRTPEAEPRSPELDPGLLREVVEEAARGVVEMRKAEGERLRVDLEGRLDRMEAMLARVEERAPLRLVAERDRLREAVRALTEGVGVDEERLAREIAHLAERWDIAEETVRFRSHLAAFREALKGPDEPVGKRLGFLVQELNREANTIGSKANDAEIAQLSMALKEELERVREQVENVE